MRKRGNRKCFKINYEERERERYLNDKECGVEVRSSFILYFFFRILPIYTHNNNYPKI
jgi:hypothetical protein